MPRELRLELLVAPYTGAWIEIGMPTGKGSTGDVAPYTGAWIEIRPDIRITTIIWSLPTRERGLKSQIFPGCQPARGRSLHGSVD